MERILLKNTCNLLITFSITTFLFLCFTSALNAQVEAKFTYSINTKCVPVTMSVTNNSTGSGLTHEWDFGTGSFSSVVGGDSEFQKVFYTPNTYKVRLRVTDGANTDIKEVNIDCFAKPAAAMQVTNGKGCGTITAQFIDQSIQGSAPITSYEWVLQNGDMVTGKNASYTYNVPGKYDVDLIVTDGNGCTDYKKSKDIIEVFPVMNAGFESDRTFLCSPGYIRFEDTTASTVPLSYRWYFGNGQTSTLKSPIVEFRNSGFYNITLVVENDYGCYDSIVRPNYISINKDEAKFQIFDESNNLASNKDTVCPGYIFFKNNSVQGITSTWYINNVKIPSAYIENNRDLRYPLNTPGQTIVKLTVGSSGCYSSKIDTIYIDNIKANFDFTDNDACAVPKEINFVNNSINATNYIWDFEDGTRAFSSNPSHIITDVDTVESGAYEMDKAYYEVKLTAINARGCVSVMKKNYTFTFPKASMVPMKIKGCVPLYDEFYSRSLSLQKITNHKWIFDDGNSNSTGDVESTSYTYNNIGTYRAYLVIENEKGCIDTSNRVTINVGPEVEPSFTVSPDTICVNDVLSITNTTVSPYTLDKVHYSSYGIFSEYGAGSGTTNIDISAEELYDQDILMEVEINGCLSDTLVTNAYYIEGPLANFDIKTSCENPLEYELNSKADVYESMLWDFGDGSSSSVKDTVKKYAEGKYTVTLTATNSTTGCPDDFRTIDIIVQKVIADFTSTPDTFICVSNLPISEHDVIEFSGATSSSYDQECNNVPFRWNFGDNSAWYTSSSPYQSHTYINKSSPNVYVSLAVEDSKGCIDTLVREYDLIEPSAEFVMDTTSGCYPEFPVTFTYDTAANSTVSTWYWEYDNTTGIRDSDVVSPSHTYKKDYETNLSPQLTVVDKYGCDNRETKTVSFIRPNPDFYHSTSSYLYSKNFGACLNSNINFTATPFYASDSSNWEIENDTLSSKKVVHAFNSVGFKKVIHHAYRKGCTDTASVVIEVEEANADFAAYDTTQACNMSMRFYHKLENGTVNKDVNYTKWTFDDEGNWSDYKDDTVYFSYSVPGKHTPKLAITTKYGCKDTSELEIEIIRPWARVKVEDDTICPHTSVLFTIEDVMYNTNQYWILENLAHVSSDSMYHAFEQSGDYTIGIHVENEQIPGCEYDGALYINVQEIHPGFKMSEEVSLCVNDTIDIEDTSTLVNSYKWEINDQVVSTSSIVPPYPVSDTGEVMVRLIVQNAIGCTDTLEKSLHTYASPIVDLPDYVYCAGTDSIQVVASASGDNVTYLWNYIETISNRTIADPYITIDTTKTLYLTTTSEYNCKSIDSSKVLFLPEPIYYRSQQGIDTVIFIDQTLDLAVGSSNPSTYRWEPAEFAYTPDEAATTISVDDTVLFTVLTEDQCFSRIDSFNIIVHDGFVIDMPNAFRPAADDNSHNRIVYVRGIGIAELISFQVFNRWGNLIFESDDLERGWDGYYKGKLLPAGAYGYQVTVRSFRNNEHYLKGTILLLR